MYPYIEVNSFVKRKLLLLTQLLFFNFPNSSVGLCLHVEYFHQKSLRTPQKSFYNIVACRSIKLTFVIVTDDFPIVPYKKTYVFIRENIFYTIRERGVHCVLV